MSASQWRRWARAERFEAGGGDGGGGGGGGGTCAYADLIACNI